MKSKIFSLVGLSIFIVALLAVFVSAASFSIDTNSLNFDKNDSSQTFTITNNNVTDNLSIVLSSQQITDINGKNITINFSLSSLTIPGGNSTTIQATTNTAENGFLFGSFSKPYVIYEIGNSSNNQTLTLSFLNSFCSRGSANENNLRLKVDINNKGQGDDNDWMPLDTIEVKVGLENNKDLSGNGDLNDVMFELGLFKQGSSNNIMNDMMWISKDDEKVKVGDIDEGDDKKYTFKFRVDPREVKDANYVLRVKAFPKRDESGTCIDYSDDLADFGSSDYSADIRVSKENSKEKMVVVDKESYPLITNAFCGEQVSLPVDVYNIGDEDFDNQVKVTLFNKILGINEDEIASGDLNEGEKTNVAFSFKVPKDADEKTYTLLMETFYDYNKDDKTYDENSDNTFGALLKVEGNCISVSTASVSATLVSGGKAGEDLIVKAIVKNTGDKISNYLVNAAGYTSWASSANVNPITFTLNPGESKDVLITLRAKDDASGEGLFNLEVLSGNELVQTQKVSVSIEETPKGFFTGGIIGNSNLYFWGLGLLNVILILSIVFVVVRLMRK